MNRDNDIAEKCQGEKVEGNFSRKFVWKTTFFSGILAVQNSGMIDKKKSISNSLIWETTFIQKVKKYFCTFWNVSVVYRWCFFVANQKRLFFNDFGRIVLFVRGLLLKNQDKKNNKFKLRATRRPAASCWALFVFRVKIFSKITTNI